LFFTAQDMPQVVIGKVDNVPVGNARRVHYYEGYSLEQVTFQLGLSNCSAQHADTDQRRRRSQRVELTQGDWMVIAII